MSGWWRQLQQRERHALLLAGLVLLSVAVYLLLLEPLHQQLRDERQSRAALAAQQAQLQDLILRYRALPAAPSEGESLLSLIDSSARQQGLVAAIKRLTPVDGRQVQLQLQAARFDRLLGWLQQLAEQHGVAVGQLTLRRGERNGLVDGSLLLRRPS